ncbi:phosphoribosylglycinamide formyltransferase [Parvularcula oceani]|uniref:phosphoribosylglycinamide formyltransferase n=1 Tax=Parvularcula oceani TaxID=1247963 RepID=UPI00068EBFDB|nr:phosphoribosylglycinamide formyltransferase [Parvularcula oceani]
MKRVAVLISGSGSNLQALIDAAQAEDYPAEIVLVLSNRPGAYGLERARAAGIETDVLDHKSFATREDFDAALDARLREAAPDAICLAGFMRVLTAGFVEGWRGRILNIHPSLLPAFRGLHVHRQALEAGVKLSGCTVHVVTPELDDGPIIGQAAVPVLPGDDEDSLAARTLKAEHRLYPAALRRFLEGGGSEADGEARLISV